MMLKFRNLLAVTCCIVAAGGVLCAAEKSPHSGHGGAAKSALGVVSLDVFAEGQSRVHLLTATRSAMGEPPRISYARSYDGGTTWAAPVAIGEGQPTPDPVKRGNDAQIVASGERVLAVWTIGANTKMGRGALAAAVSQDGGRTWRAAPSPSDANASAVIDHAFVDLAADERGAFHAVWLDARTKGNSTEFPGKGLRYARSLDGGQSWSANATLDEQCCECCWNTLLTTSGGGVHVLYRDRDPRDMAIISSPNGGRTWGNARPVGEFKWNFNGCPHVGGALAAGYDGGALSAVVWTGKGGADLGVFALASLDGGRNWTKPQRLGGPQSSRPDMAADGGRRIVAAWDEYVDSAQDLGNVAFAASSSDGGATWSPPVRLSAPGASATYPRVVQTSGGFRAFWTQKQPGRPATWESHLLETSP
jgi:hypothetical protein